MLRLLIFFLLSLFIFSCSKDEALPATINNSSTTYIPSSEKYYPLKRGNWWVYDYYYINTNTGKEYFEYRDSVYIIGDTIINGHKYAYQKNTYQDGWLYLRDSLGYMATIGGEKFLFSCTNFSDTFNIDSSKYSYTIYTKMMHHDTLIPTPVGSFHSISKAYIWRCMNTPAPKNEYLFFGEGIGMTQYCHWYYCSCIGKIEGRLVKYHLE